MMIGNDWKYVILMVREAKCSSRESLADDESGVPEDEYGEDAMGY